MIIQSTAINFRIQHKEPKTNKNIIKVNIIQRVLKSISKKATNLHSQNQQSTSLKLLSSTFESIESAHLGRLSTK